MFLVSEVPLYSFFRNHFPHEPLELFKLLDPLDYRGTSLTTKRTPLGPYRRPMPRVLEMSWGGGRFLVGEVPLYSAWELPGVVSLAL